MKAGKVGKENMERGYKRLIVWQEAKKLVVLVYRLTEDFPI